MGMKITIEAEGEYKVLIKRERMNRVGVIEGVMDIGEVEPGETKEFECPNGGGTIFITDQRVSGVA